MAANHRVRQIHIFDHSLEFPAVVLGHLATEDHGDLVRLANGSIGVQQPFSQSVQSGAAAEDQIVAKLDLGKEEPVLATSLFAFLFGEKGSEGGQPFLTTLQDVASGEGIG